jgi:hypothetical protein
MSRQVTEIKICSRVSWGRKTKSRILAKISAVLYEATDYTGLITVQCGKRFDSLDPNF